MELETVANYLADSVNLDGVRSELVKSALADDIAEELGHATKLANRIKQLGGLVRGAAKLEFSHSHLDERNETTDVIAVIKGAIADESAAIELYEQIINATDGVDFVTQDICIEILRDEEKHLTLFDGFLKEFDREF